MSRYNDYIALFNRLKKVEKHENKKRGGLRFEVIEITSPAIERFRRMYLSGEYKIKKASMRQDETVFTVYVLMYRDITGTNIMIVPVY